MFADAQRVLTFSVSAGGTGYTVGDTLTVAGGTLLSATACPARVQVSSLAAGGAVASVAPLDFGGYYLAPLTPNAVTGGTGTGCTLALTFTLYWPSVPWVVPSLVDIQRVIATDVIAPSQANIGADVADNAPFDPAAENRAQDQLNMAVARIRAAIQRGNKVPLSLTAGSVPPEAYQHALNLAAWATCLSTMNLRMFLLSEHGYSSPFGAMVKRAEDYIDALAKGANVEYPSDPDPSWRGTIRDGGYGQEADLSSYGYGWPYSTQNPNLGTL